MRLIDADKLIALCEQIAADEWNKSTAPASWSDAYMGFIDNIEIAPAVEAKPVKHGRWIATNDENKKRCSECDIIHLIAQYPSGKANFCPNCGTKMEGGKSNG